MPSELDIEVNLNRVWNPADNTIVLCYQRRGFSTVALKLSTVLVEMIEKVCKYDLGPSCYPEDLQYCLNEFSGYLKENQTPTRYFFYGTFYLWARPSYSPILYTLGDSITLLKPDGVALAEAINASAQAIKNFNTESY